MSEVDTTIGAGCSPGVSSLVRYRSAGARCFNCYRDIPAGDCGYYHRGLEVVVCAYCAATGFTAYSVSPEAIEAAAAPEYVAGVPVLAGDVMMLCRDTDLPGRAVWRGWFGGLIGRYEQGGSASLFNVLGLGGAR